VFPPRESESSVMNTAITVLHVMTLCSLTLGNLFLQKVRTHLPDYPHIIVTQNSCFGSMEILQHTIHLNPFLKCAVHNILVVKHVVCTGTKSRRRCAEHCDAWRIYVSAKRNATVGCIQSGVPRSKKTALLPSICQNTEPHNTSP
jgi:hypothetical protein